MRLSLVAVFTLFVAQSWAAFVERPGCPSVCECYQDRTLKTRGRSSRSVIDCSGRNLFTIPEIYYRGSGNLALVDLSDNLLTTLDINRLYSLIRGLRVDVLDLSNNNISEVTGRFDASRGIDYAALNLSNNSFTAFPSSVIPLSHLRAELILDFSNNRLTELPRHMFADTDERVLYGFQFLARNNSIARVDPDAFQGVTLVDTIVDLRSNLLTTLSEDFRNPRGVREIRLSDNPWHCDCSLRWVIDPGRYLINFTASDPPNCNDPAPLRGRPIFRLRGDEFACPPYLDGSPIIDITDVEQQYTLICPVSADPPNPDISWTLWIPLPGRDPARVEFASESVTLPRGFRVAARCTASNSAGSLDVDLVIRYNGELGIPIPVGPQ